jgi:hypothetical protein
MVNPQSIRRFPSAGIYSATRSVWNGYQVGSNRQCRGERSLQLWLTRALASPILAMTSNALTHSKPLSSSTHTPFFTATRCRTASDHAIVIRIETAAATDRAAHGESAAAGATTATDRDRLSAETSATETAHVSPEEEVEAEASATMAATDMTHPEVPAAAAHQHPAALAGPTSHLVAAPSSLPVPPTSQSRRKRRPMWT